MRLHGAIQVTARAQLRLLIHARVRIGDLVISTTESSIHLSLPGKVWAYIPLAFIDPLYSYIAKLPDSSRPDLNFLSGNNLVITVCPATPTLVFIGGVPVQFDKSELRGLKAYLRAAASLIRREDEK